MTLSVAETPAVLTETATTTVRPRRLARFEVAYLGSFAALLAGLAYLFPRSGDDWAWGTHLGIQRMHDFFGDYNGRYAGNLFILFLMRATYLIPLFEAAIAALTLWLLLDLVGNRTRLGYAAAITLFMGMPLADWRESVQWASGFANYAPAALGVVVFLRAVKADWLGVRSQRPQAARSAGIVVAGFVFALFIENVTIYLVLASITYAVVHRAVRKRFSADSIAWAVAFLAGAVAMFSNSAYTRSLEGNNGVHHASDTGLKGRILKLLDPISRYTVSDNWMLNITLAVVLCVVVSANRHRMRRRWAVLITSSALGSLLVAFALLAARHVMRPGPLLRCFAGVAGGLMLLALVVTAFAVIGDRFGRAQVLVAVASVLVLVAPLEFVEPIGPRQFYVTYLLFVGLALLLLRDVTTGVDPVLVQRIVPLVVVVAVAIFAWYFRIYGVVHAHAGNRVEHIRAAVDRGATSVTVHPLPYGDYVHRGDPRGARLEQRYEAYYHLPADLKITVKK